MPSGDPGQAPALPAHALLFVNVSPQSLDRDELAGSALVHAVAAAGLQADRVVIEIAARATTHLDVVVREAACLRRLGFRLALDDTGSGHAGLEVLSQLAVDFVKVDREVIVRAQAGTGGRGILAGIVAIAHEMRATIIAEGIENVGMLDLIRSATLASPLDTAAQGYFLGRPQSRFASLDDALAGKPAQTGSRPRQFASVNGSYRDRH